MDKFTNQIIKPHCYVRDADREIVALTFGATQEEANAQAAQIKQWLDAPLLVLGRANELRTIEGPARHLTEQVPQWHVIHEGERKLLTRAEIDDLVFALEFVE